MSRLMWGVGLIVGAGLLVGFTALTGGAILPLGALGYTILGIAVGAGALFTGISYGLGAPLDREASSIDMGTQSSPDIYSSGDFGIGGGTTTQAPHRIPAEVPRRISIHPATSASAAATAA